MGKSAIATLLAVASAFDSVCGPMAMYGNPLDRKPKKVLYKDVKPYSGTKETERRRRRIEKHGGAL